MKKALLILLCFPAVCQAQSELLDKFFQKTEQQALQADFTLTVADNASQPMTYNGTISMQGERFYLTMWDMEMAYDGTTLYTYTGDTEELTLSTPTEEELKESNPILLAKALAESCQVRYGRNHNTNNKYVIELIPDNKEAGVQKFVLQLQADNLLPISAEMKESATKSTTLLLRNAQYVKAPQTFRIDKPNAIINDLR